MSDLKQYFDTHPCLKVASVEKAAGIAPRTLMHYLKGRRELSEQSRERVIEVVKEYGYVPFKVQETNHVPLKVHDSEPVPFKVHVPKKVHDDVPKKVQATNPSTESFKMCLDVWLEWYESEQGEKYDVDGVAGKSLKHIIKKLTTKCKQKGADPTPENITDAFKWLLTRVKEDDWIMQNCQLRHINQNFNKLIAKRNGNKANSLPDQRQLVEEAQRRAHANQQSGQ